MGPEQSCEVDTPRESHGLSLFLLENSPLACDHCQRMEGTQGLCTLNWHACSQDLPPVSPIPALDFSSTCCLELHSF